MAQCLVCNEHSKLRCGHCHHEALVQIRDKADMCSFKSLQVRLPVSALACKELPSHHLCPHNKRKVEQIENQQLFLDPDHREKPPTPNQTERQIHRMKTCWTEFQEQKPPQEPVLG